MNDFKLISKKIRASIELVSLSESGNTYFNAETPERFAPNPISALSITLSDIARFCGKSRAKIKNRMSAEQIMRSFPDNVHFLDRQFSLADAREIIIQNGDIPRRSTDHPGKVIVFGGYKTQTGKTLLAVETAKGLALRGQKVLFIDLDANANATRAFGKSGYKKALFENTISGQILSKKLNFATISQPTYWPGLDLLEANHSLLYASIFLSESQDRFKEFNEQASPISFVTVGLEVAKAHYDVVVIDTSSSFSMLERSAVFAGDMLFFPTEPTYLGFHGMLEYLNLLVLDVLNISELIKPTDVEKLSQRFLQSKAYDLVEIVETKVDVQYWEHAYIHKVFSDAFPQNLSKTRFPIKATEPAQFLAAIDNFINRIIEILHNSWLSS